MKTKLIIILLLISSITMAQLPRDKQLHFAAGATIAVPVTVYEMVKHQNTPEKSKLIAFEWAMGAVTFAGVSKECYDLYRGGQFDMEDLTCTMIGGGISYIITSLAAIDPKRPYQYRKIFGTVKVDKDTQMIGLVINF